MLYMLDDNFIIPIGHATGCVSRGLYILRRQDKRKNHNLFLHASIVTSYKRNLQNDSTSGYDKATNLEFNSINL